MKISGTNIGKGLKTQDSVEITGISYNGENAALKKQLEALNSTHIIQAAGDDYVVVIGLIDAGHTQQNGIHADRKAPAMDWVIECNNRLWGCRYGQENGQTLNEISDIICEACEAWKGATPVRKIAAIEGIMNMAAAIPFSETSPTTTAIRPSLRAIAS